MGGCEVLSYSKPGYEPGLKTVNEEGNVNQIYDMKKTV